jgi:hypothetical protein
MLKQPWVAVVVALGTDKKTFIFEENGSSPLIRDVKKRGYPAVIWSNTACTNKSTADGCRAEGADDVLCSPEALHSLLSRVTNSKVAYSPPQARNGSLNSHPRIAQQLGRLPRPLLLPSTPPSEKVRFVCVSDTHHMHQQIAMPLGDVLLHAGDFIGNYGKGDKVLFAHLEDFLSWVVACSTQYALVVLIAGNHDTLLDAACYPQHTNVREKFLAALPKNVAYLENSGVTHRGLTIWGTPVSASRLEREGQRFYSDAFERTAAERVAAYAGIPEACDVLLTHTPPRGMLGGTQHSDECLAERLQRGLARPPRYHVFGHDHDFYGAGSYPGNKETICLNAAQAGHLRKSKQWAAGCPIVFDVGVAGSVST